VNRVVLSLLVFMAGVVGVVAYRLYVASDQPAVAAVTVPDLQLSAPMKPPALTRGQAVALAREQWPEYASKPMTARYGSIDTHVGTRHPDGTVSMLGVRDV
jgi:hypothetical protein